MATFLYAWNAAGNLEIYYAAAVRSMSMSWHNFFFGSVDPAGTITLDKLPGAFWVQAISVKLFGLHPWAFVAPQVVEGALTVLVMFRVVNRLAGATAGILAAALLAVSPAVVALDRGNISDSLLILLLVSAADFTVGAVQNGRWAGLGWAGVLVGVAFQAKMVEAWMVLPALALTYLVAAPHPVRRRLAHLIGLGGAAGVVSLAWMTVVALWPAGSRPYVDGSSDNSIFSQVFIYNFVHRVNQATPNKLLSQAIGLKGITSGPAAWNRLLTGDFGRDAARLLPAAVVSMIVLAALARDKGRRDPLQMSWVLWGTWLAVFFLAFTTSPDINSYYLAALAPPVSALLAVAGVAAWPRRGEPMVRSVVAAVVVVTVGYAVWLLPPSGEGLPAGLAAVAGVVGLLAVVGAVTRAFPYLALAVTACLLVPTVGAVSIVTKGYGPFDTPFEPPLVSAGVRSLSGTAALVEPTIGPLRRGEGHPDLMATQTAALAAPYIYDTGQEVLPIGGFTGSTPSPTLNQIKAMIAEGRFHLVIQAPTVNDPRLVWVAAHCLHLNTGSGTSGASGAPRFSVYYCG